MSDRLACKPTLPARTLSDKYYAPEFFVLGVGIPSTGWGQESPLLLCGPALKFLLKASQPSPASPGIHRCQRKAEHPAYSLLLCVECPVPSGFCIFK